MKTYHVYIITNYKSTVLYTGITSNLEKRIHQHKQGTFNNSFTKKYRLYKLIWYQQFNHVSDAITAEKKIKGWTRTKKLDLIKTLNPQLEDLITDQPT